MYLPGFIQGQKSSSAPVPAKSWPRLPTIDGRAPHALAGAASAAGAKQAAIDLPLAVFEVDEIPGSIQIRALAIGESGNAECAGEFTDRFEHDVPHFLRFVCTEYNIAVQQRPAWETDLYHARNAWQQVYVFVPRP